MAFTRDKRAMGQVGRAALALCLCGMPAASLTVVSPCIGNESGMYLAGANVFGNAGSRFATDIYYNNYGNLTGDPNNPEVPLPAPVPDLNNFAGFRVVDCKSGRFLAIGGANGGAAELAATQPLRDKVRDHAAFTLADVKNAAEILYRGQDVKILTLRETEQTCSCREFGGQ